MSCCQMKHLRDLLYQWVNCLSGGAPAQTLHRPEKVGHDQILQLPEGVWMMTRRKRICEAGEGVVYVEHRAKHCRKDQRRVHQHQIRVQNRRERRASDDGDGDRVNRRARTRCLRQWQRQQPTRR